MKLQSKTKQNSGQVLTIKKTNVSQIPANQIQLSKESLISCVQTQKQRDRSGSAGGISIIRQTPNNNNQGTYSIDTGSKPQFFNPTNSIPTSIKTGNRVGPGAKGVKIKTPTQTYYSE